MNRDVEKAAGGEIETFWRQAKDWGQYFESWEKMQLFHILSDVGERFLRVLQSFESKGSY